MKTRVMTEMVEIGRVSAPSGVKGEVRINLYSQDSENLKEGKVLLLKRVEGNGVSPEIRTTVKRIRLQKDRPVVKFDGIDDRTAAENLRGMAVCVESAELEELPEGEHYVRNLLGCTVVDIAGGNRKEVGILREVIQNTSQSILDVENTDGKHVLIPAVDAFLRKIDEDEKLIEVELIPGFLD